MIFQTLHSEKQMHLQCKCPVIRWIGYLRRSSCTC